MFRRCETVVVLTTVFFFLFFFFLYAYHDILLLHVWVNYSRSTSPDIPEHVPAPMEADDAGSGEEGFDEPEAPPPPPRRALPPRVVDLGKAEEGAETEEEGLGHEGECLPFVCCHVFYSFF